MYDYRHMCIIMASVCASCGWVDAIFPVLVKQLITHTLTSQRAAAQQFLKDKLRHSAQIDNKMAQFFEAHGRLQYENL